MSDVHVCSFYDCSGHAKLKNGVLVWWDFSKRFGPLFTDMNGAPLENQPGVRTASFKAFQTWHEELQRERSIVSIADRNEREQSFRSFLAKLHGAKP